MTPSDDLQRLVERIEGAVNGCPRFGEDWQEYLARKEMERMARRFSRAKFPLRARITQEQSNDPSSNG